MPSPLEPFTLPDGTIRRPTQAELEGMSYQDILAFSEAKKAHDQALALANRPEAQTGDNPLGGLAHNLAQAFTVQRDYGDLIEGTRPASEDVLSGANTFFSILPNIYQTLNSSRSLFPEFDTDLSWMDVSPNPALGFTRELLDPLGYGEVAQVARHVGDAATVAGLAKGLSGKIAETLQNPLARSDPFPPARPFEEVRDEYVAKIESMANDSNMPAPLRALFQGEIEAVKAAKGLEDVADQGVRNTLFREMTKHQPDIGVQGMRLPDDIAGLLPSLQRLSRPTPAAKAGDPKKVVDDFLESADSSTQSTFGGEVPRYEVYLGDSVMQLEPYADGHLFGVPALYIRSWEGGGGKGSLTPEDEARAYGLLQRADEHGVFLVTKPLPFNVVDSAPPEVFAREQRILERHYRRLGFVDNPAGPGMIRYPNQYLASVYHDNFGINHVDALTNKTWFPRDDGQRKALFEITSSLLEDVDPENLVRSNVIQGRLAREFEGSFGASPEQAANAAEELIELVQAERFTRQRAEGLRDARGAVAQALWLAADIPRNSADAFASHYDPSKQTLEEFLQSPNAPRLGDEQINEVAQYLAANREFLQQADMAKAGLIDEAAPKPSPAAEEETAQQVEDIIGGLADRLDAERGAPVEDLVDDGADLLGDALGKSFETGIADAGKLVDEALSSSPSLQGMLGGMDAQGRAELVDLLARGLYMGGFQTVPGSFIDNLFRYQSGLDEIPEEFYQNLEEIMAKSEAVPGWAAREEMLSSDDFNQLANEGADQNEALIPLEPDDFAAQARFDQLADQGEAMVTPFKGIPKMLDAFDQVADEDLPEYLRHRWEEYGDGVVQAVDYIAYRWMKEAGADRVPPEVYREAIRQVLDPSLTEDQWYEHMGRILDEDVALGERFGDELRTLDGTDGFHHLADEGLMLDGLETGSRFDQAARAAGLSETQAGIAREILDRFQGADSINGATVYLENQGLSPQQIDDIIMGWLEGD